MNLFLRIALLSVFFVNPIFVKAEEPQSLPTQTNEQSGSQTLPEASPQEPKIHYKDVVLGIPDTSIDALKVSFSKESIPWWIGILGSSVILYHNDEVILRDWQREGRNAGIGNEDNTRPVLYIGDIDLIRLPTDTGSFLYFLGDGWMNFGIAGGFYFYGRNNNDNRAFNTSLRIVHGMAVSTIFNQFLKRATGRESPYVRTEDKGKWSPFPSLKEYQSKTPSYDAVPSGHVMTSTLIFTIIDDNYPEYSVYTRSIGAVWISALSYQMVNNGVHWASDYPLGIAMGYVFGKAASKLGRTTNELQSDVKAASNWMLLPATQNGAEGLTFLTTF